MAQPLLSLYQLDGDLSRAAVIDALADIPVRLRSLTEAAQHTALQRPSAHGEWSAFQVCCHVRDAALVYSARFRWIVFDDDPFLPNYDENNWVESARDTVEDLPGILDEFESSRADLVRVLSRLPESAWARTGRHEVLGSVTLEPYVRHQLAHEEAHLAQLATALRGAVARGA